MFERYQVNNQGVQKEITAVIEKDATLNGEIKQLSNSKCDCENNSGVSTWPFPIICTILAPIFLFLLFLIMWLRHSDFVYNMFILCGRLGIFFNCPWITA
jgi:hypothetical protein